MHADLARDDVGLGGVRRLLGRVGQDRFVPFVGGVALASPSFNWNPFYAANNN